MTRNIIPQKNQGSKGTVARPPATESSLAKAPAQDMSATVSGPVPSFIQKFLKLGQRNAITARELATKLGNYNDRAVRLAIRELIAQGIPIASSVTTPMGFFIADSRDETDAYISNLRSRIKEDAFRLRDFKRACRDIRSQGQLKLI